ncbi:MAG: Rrf2 family transcriptional regulator [Phycisphaerales bacterium]|nr:Rrf2 family transcriptional regulator [Phycisphaerales bacterium]
MLRISKKADYAVFLLGAIARQGAYPGGHNPEAVVSAHEIARLAKLNKSVVANLLKEFAKHGLLDSVRGLKGGYRLAKAPAAIALADILEVVEGRFTLVECVAHGHAADGAAPAAGEAASGGGLLSLAPSMRATDDHDGADCALIAFCPSKAPMRVVHDRIARLFRDIKLDELCALPPTHHSSGPAATRPAAPASAPAR